MLAAPGGLVVLKEWERLPRLATLASLLAERYIGGDPGVRYPTMGELRQTIAAGIPGAKLHCEARIPPHRNNVLLAVRKPAQA
jgi:hypothetical protein